MNYKILTENALFNTISHDDIETVLNCLNAYEKNYYANDIIILTDEPIYDIGIIISGSVIILREDINGNINIISEMGENDIFAESLVFADKNISPITVTAQDDCKILFINAKKILKTCSKTCDFHHILIENMLKITANKNILLNQKIDILSKRTTKDKILTFLNYYKKTSKIFTIPFNREEMASFLSVDRSALSSELSKLKKSNIIDFYKNEFKIK